MNEKDRATTTLSCEIRQYVRKAQNVLASSKNSSEICETLSRIKRFLPDRDIDIDREAKCTSTAAEKDIFLKNHYVRFLEFLLQTASLDWMQQLNEAQRKNLFEVFFLDGIHRDAFVTLCSCISQTSSANPSFKLNYCLSLLKSFIEGHRLYDVIISLNDKDLSNNLIWEQTISLLVTLPDRTANILQMDNYEIFYPQQYYRCLSMEILAALRHLHESLQSSDKECCSLQFLGQLVGRICVGGKAKILFDVIFPFLVRNIRESELWQSIGNRLVLNVPARCLESFLECLVTKAASSCVLSNLLGDAVLTNSKLGFLLTHKFVFVRYYEDSSFLGNIIRYLANSSSRRTLFMQMLFKLLDVWGDSSAIQHTSYDQHLYITKAILLSTKYLNNDEKRVSGEQLIQKLMVAVPCHLESPVFKIRRLGMIVAEVLTESLAKDGQGNLKFDYEANDQETKMLFSLLKEEIMSEDKVSSSLDENKTAAASISDCSDQLEDRKKMETCSVLDSDDDDDLEPYDMSADTEHSKTSPPLYLIDCFDGLKKTDDPDHFKICLENVERLVRANPSNLIDMCIDLTRLLLHLQDNSNTDNFVQLRFSALVAITVLCPVKTASYLTEEFYEKNYNTRQRLDILDVLAAAAQQLSLPFDMVTPANTKIERHQTYPPTRRQEGESSPKEDWKSLVQKRIEAKTRYFSQSRKNVALPTPPSPNRFATVASYFFFPLINNYDKTCNTLDLLGNDFLLLGRMLYTLGVVTQAAINTPICLQMSTRLFEFIWAIRFHKEPFVRQSLLFALSMVLFSVPQHALVSDLNVEVMEAKQWLENIIDNQVDKESKQLALQCLLQLQNLLRKEFVS